MWGIGVYNSLVALRNDTENAWAQVDVVLRRRFDLIPNLMETVKGYATHEKDVFEHVAQARAMVSQASGPAAQGQAENMLTGALKSLFAVTEAYPDLKANVNFMDMQKQLAATEGMIAFARQAYNDSVLALNTVIQIFPSNIIANRYNFVAKEYYPAEPLAVEAPKVKF